MRALALLLLVALVAGCSGAAAQAPPSDDGLDLALVRTVPGNPPQYELLRIDADGRRPGEAVPSPAGVAGVGGLSWAPDGRLLVVGTVGERNTPTYSAGRADLFVIGTDGRSRRLTETGDVLGAAMSPDGSTVAVARQTLTPRAEDVSTRLWLMDGDGGNRRPLLPEEPGRHDVPGAWSPDGGRLAFARTINRLGSGGALRSGTTIWVVKADGTGARRIAEGRFPAWSPDGTRIAFASIRDRNGKICGGDDCHTATELYTMAPDGSDLRRITRTADDETAPAWSSDGRWLAYERGTNRSFADAVWTSRPDGSCARRLAGDQAGVVSYRSPAWVPGATVERDCATPPRHAAVPAVRVAGLDAARAFRGHPLYWLGPTWRGRRLTGIDASTVNAGSTYFFYGDCRTSGRGCAQVQYQITDVCRAPPPNVRGPLPGIAVTRARIRGAPAFNLGFQWEVYTGRVMIRVFATGRAGRQVIAALRGLNPPAKNLRPGRPFPPPIAGALERRLPCPRGG
jgi:Tol biopolymer transport system component